MGLPLWRDPDERRESGRVEKPTDPTASNRSSIRRRPSVHSARHQSRRRRYFITDQRDRSPSVDNNLVERRSERSEVPSIPTLLEPNVSSGPRVPPHRFRDDMSLRLDENVLRPAIPAPRQINTSQLEDHIRRHGRNRSHDLTQIQIERLERINALRSRLRGQDSSHATQTAERQFASLQDASAISRRETTRDDVEVEPSYHGNTHMGRGSHPLRHSWRPDSPLNGLGDRNRSPTPADGWENLRSTIAPDENLPSADSSFASTAASQSFTNGNGSRLAGSDDQSSSNATVVPDDLACLDDTPAVHDITGALADRVYQYENNTVGGPRRINEHHVRRTNEGNRFAFPHEPQHIEIGFRLIEEYLGTVPGRRTLVQLGVINSENMDSAQSRERNDREASTRAPSPAISEPSQPPVPPETTRGEQISGPDQDRTRSWEHSLSLDQMRAREQSTSVHGVSRTFPAPPPDPPRVPRTNPDSRATSRTTDLLRASAGRNFSSATALSEEERGQLERELHAVRRVWPRLEPGEELNDDWWAQIGLLLSHARHYGPDAITEVLAILASTRNERGSPPPA